MNIAQVAPLYESVPPKYYGGTERVVSYLTEELVNQGHQVTLFASGDSVTHARLVAPCQHALRLDQHCRDSLAPHVVMLEQVFRNGRTVYGDERFVLPGTPSMDSARRDLLAGARLS